MTTTAPKITSPRALAAYLESKRTALGYDGLVVLDKDGNLLLDVELAQEAHGFERMGVLRQVLGAGPRAQVFAAYSVADNMTGWVDSMKGTVKALRQAGAAVGLHLCDFIVIEHSSAAWHSFRAAEGWNQDQEA